MLAAQIRGKLTRQEEDLEDLLTSNVFGSIKYVPCEDGLIPLLSSAEDMNESTTLKGLPQISTVSYEFWPHLENENGTACEPDVLIRIEHITNAQTIILVEAKYKSGKSSEADDNDKPNDQLAREWDVLTDLVKKNNITPYLLYVTADVAYPKKDINESQVEIWEKREKRIDISWISWRKLSRIFKYSKWDILKDLVEVLERQGLIFFEEFTVDYINATKWRFQSSVKQSVIPLNLNWFFNVPTIEWKYDTKDFIQGEWTSLKCSMIKWRFTKMNEDGKNILNLVQQTRKLCEQISLLLQTVDEQMDKKGWEEYSNTIMSDTSASLLHPKRWFPDVLFRFYTHNENKHILLFVSVLLDDIGWFEKYEEAITEPLITAGCFNYGQDKDVGDWEYWFARWYGYMENRKDNGTIHESKKSWQEDWGEEYPFESYKCFGLPLVSITNAQDAESKIVKPLLDLLPK